MLRSSSGEGAAFAPAKVNLYLHVGPPDAAGMHPLSSLAVFADVGDEIRIARAEAASFAVEGPFAGGLAGEGDNLVLRALRGLEAAGAILPPLRVVLDKRLPVAAGLGGGSSDAAAALRLARDRFARDLPDARLAEIMAALGADGPMCLAAHPVIAEGYGERLSAAPGFPDLPAVLVNPGVPSPTPQVYRAYDAAGRFGGAARAGLAEAYTSPTALAEALADARNDLEAPALAVQPAAGVALARLRRAPETLLARVSGSGATVFALCADRAAAARLAGEVKAERPDWWVSPCILAGKRIGAV